MCNTREIADAFGQEVASMGFDTYWYHAFLGNCSMLTMTGNLRNPNLKEKQGNETFAIGNQTGLSFLVSADAGSVANRANREPIHHGDRKGERRQPYHGKLPAVGQAAAIAQARVSLDIFSIKRGCYILTIRDDNVTLLKERIVSVY